MPRRLTHGMSLARLRLVLGALLVALAVPTAILVMQTQRQLKWESYHQYRTLAEALAARIDAELKRLVAAEEARSYADYRFLQVAGDPATSNVLQRSPLAAFPVAAEVPGLLGYFQVDAAGAFSTPLLPDAQADPAQLGLDAEELRQRETLRDRLLQILRQHALVARLGGESAPAASSPWRSADDLLRQARAPVCDARSQPDAMPAAQAPPSETPAQESAPPANEAATSGFDKLNAPASSSSPRGGRSKIGRLDDLPLSKTYQSNVQEKLETQAGAKDDAQWQQRASDANELRFSRKEQAAEPDVQALDEIAGNLAMRRVRIFESEVDPFEFGLLDSGHGVLFRKVWRDGQRTIQGAVIDMAPFLERAFAAPFRGSALAPMSDLVVAFEGDVLLVTRAAMSRSYGSSAAALEGEVLQQTALSAPLGGFQLVWSIKHLPPGPGARLVLWTAAVLMAVLLLGFLALYRLGARQIALAEQQQDFVSAVSHELKTPLTSIRMYAEMLRQGWTTPDKQREYYAYIHDESERLSRLIANVLQLARMERNDLQLDLKPVAVATLMDLLRSKLASQFQQAGFTGAYVLDPACAMRELALDADAFLQIMINLTDNALKFSARAGRREVEIATRPGGEHTVVWSVRDYGPGVPRAQMRRIFELFYRSGSELTRETVGTGIGLALVRQLARAMRGEVDVVNRDPGAEFRVVLPVRTGA